MFFGGRPPVWYSLESHGEQIFSFSQSFPHLEKEVMSFSGSTKDASDFFPASS